MLVKIGQKYNVDHKSDPYRYMDNVSMYKLQDAKYTYINGLFNNTFPIIKFLEYLCY